MGLSPKEAARFSFLLAIPAIGGAGLLTALDMEGSYPFPGPVALAGLVSSFIVGVAALKWLLGWLEEGKFHYFGIYCLCVGLITVEIRKGFNRHHIYPLPYLSFGCGSLDLQIQ